MDTQLIRNAYCERSVDDLCLGFGEFASNYLGVKDETLKRMFNLNEACNYIIANNLNHHTPIVYPEIMG